MSLVTDAKSGLVWTIVQQFAALWKKWIKWAFYYLIVILITYFSRK